MGNIFSCSWGEEEITKYQLQEIVKKKEKDTIIVDVRMEREFNKGHIEDAVNISYADIEDHKEKKIDIGAKLPKATDTVVVYGEPTDNTRTAARNLKAIVGCKVLLYGKGYNEEYVRWFKG
eukprot:PhF_6_TR927/c0_g1_i1/m.1595